MTVTVAPSTGGRFLPALPARGFVLGDDEALGQGLVRITVEQFDRAIYGLTEGEDVDAAVHEARKAMKRLRAVLRLVRAEIGERAYRFENGTLRDTARLIAPVRDGAVLAATVAALRRRFERFLSADAFLGLELGLTERAAAMREAVVGDQRILEGVVGSLQAARTRYLAWPVDEGQRTRGRRPIRHSFDAIGPGLRETYGRGRREMHEAMTRPSTESFHLWRKRVKYLRHQIECLDPLWPEVMTPLAGALDRLGEMLGTEHDLAEFVRLLGEQPDLCPDPIERALAAALARQRRSELQMAAVALGTRVYAERADRFTARIGGYWESREATGPV